MRVVEVAHTWIMEAAAEPRVALDSVQVKKAVQALQAYLKSSSSQKVLLSENQQLCLLLTLWKIPDKEQIIRIPLPHPLRNESTEVCLFTRDEPNMTSDQTERFYKKLLTARGLKILPEVIPFRVLRTEYKAFEAKRRLLGNFEIFLTDVRIRHRLPSHIGKHFYERKKVPLSVNMESKTLATDVERLVQGSTLTVRKKGSCCMLRVAHSGMSTDEIVENIMTAVGTVSAKMQQKGKCIKTIHLKSHTSIALPIYTSDLSHLTLMEEELKKASLEKGERKPKNKFNLKQAETTGPEEEEEEEQEEEKKKKNKKKKKKVEKEEDVEEEEEVPQLVPVESPHKMPRLKVSSKTGLKSSSRATRAKAGLKTGPAEEKRVRKSKPVQRKKGKNAS